MQQWAVLAQRLCLLSALFASRVTLLWNMVMP